MASIWHASPSVEEINKLFTKDTIMDGIGLKVTEIGDDFIRGTMPADGRTFQVYGVIHGGANVVLTETLGSIAAFCTIDGNKYQCFGQEVSATHIRSVSSGEVTGTARAIHIGKRSQVWEIRVENEEGKLTCLSKLIVAVVPTRT